MGFISRFGDGQLRAGKKRGGAQKKCRARKIAGNARFDAPQTLPAANADFILPCCSSLRAKGPQRHFAVIAGAQRFFDARFAVGEQSGKQQTRFHLRAGHRHVVVDGLSARRR